jgi:hypothetical protein
MNGRKGLVVNSLIAAVVLALGAAPAQAEFGLSNLKVEFLNSDETPATQAGSHPFAMRTSFNLNSVEERGGGKYIDGALRDLDVEQPVGFAGDPFVVPRCQTLDFLEETCSDSAAVGYVNGEISSYGNIASFRTTAVYLLEPSSGNAGKLGFWIQEEVPVAIDLRLSPDSPHRVLATMRNTPGVVEVVSSELTLWGNPADAVHNAQRGHCVETTAPDICLSGVEAEDQRPLFTLPRACTGPLTTIFRATPWWTGNPLSPTPGGPTFEGAATTPGVTGCEALEFPPPRLTAQATGNRASSPMGMDFGLDIDDPGLTDPDDIAQSDLKKAVVTLPQGVTVNPSVSAGLLTCSRDQLKAERANSEPNEGCPEASKVGSVEVETPLLEGELLEGSLFVATQDDPSTPQPGAENPFDTMIALYLVIKDRDLGIVVKQAGKVEPDPRTGQLLTTFDEIPQVPFSHLRLHLRGGERAPLIAPDQCGAYTTKAELTPWADPSKAVVSSASFAIGAGVGGGPCPPGGAPPFAPGFDAGSLDPTAGAYTPFFLRITRADGEQDITRLASVLPPGLVGKLAGIEKCSDAAIAAAKARTGRAELAAASCPSGSQIGSTLAGAGAGSELTYVGGKLYLAGPYNGAPLSVVAVVPAVAGPFDAGTVVVRVALDLDPVTAEVVADGSASDPIPHILRGIPLKVRDLRVHVDRDRFVLNPTGCEPSQVRATLWGGGLDPFSLADDAAVGRSTRFQAADCGRLGFKPRLAFRLKGGTKRGDHPAVRAVFRPRPGDSNLARTTIRLPRSAFLEQAHIRTICTRVQFAADACPKGAIYGKVRAFTPLLDEPLVGPVYLRSSDNELPDMVFDLHGLVDIETAARVDSIRGGIRITFAKVPDAPLTKVVVSMQGARKGLVVNSRSLCAAPSRASAGLVAHNAKRRTLRPAMRARCGGKGGKGAKPDKRGKAALSGLQT